MTLALIITADDLGIDVRRDDGIFYAWSKRAITQASLLVCGASAHSAAARARDLGLPLGLHLDLTETGPAANASEVSSLLDSVGRKLGKHGLREALERKTVSPSDIVREAAAQVSRFKMLTGYSPSHVDGHQHIHTVPSVASALAPLFAKVGIASVRIPEEREAPSGFYQQVSNEAAYSRAIYQTSGIRSTAAFAGLGLMGDACTAEGLIEAARRNLGATSLELMCHVGFTGHGHDDFNQSPARERELEVYASLPFAQMNDVALVSFAEANARGALT